MATAIVSTAEARLAEEPAQAEARIPAQSPARPEAQAAMRAAFRARAEDAPQATAAPAAAARMVSAMQPAAASAAAGERENRRHPRARLDIRVVWVKGTGSTVRGAVGRACDLSESGISAVLPAKIAVGEVSELQFTLPGTKDLMSARVVVRSSEGFRYGFEFVHLSQKQRESLCRVCERLAVLHH